MMTYIEMVHLLIDEFGLQVTDQDEVCMPGICVWKAYISKDHGIIFSTINLM